jgi:hypothetical protein
MKRYIMPVLCALLLITCLALGARTQTLPAPKVQAWEYKVFPAPVSEPEFAVMGGAGFELVTVATVPTETGPRTMYFFKRPK